MSAREIRDRSRSNVMISILLLIIRRSVTRLSVFDVPESAAKCYTDRGPRRVVPSPPALYRKALDQNRKIS